MSTPNKVVPLIRMDTAVSYLNGQEPGDAVQATALHRGFMFGYEHEGRMVAYFEDSHPGSPLVRGQRRIQGVFGQQPVLKLYRYDPDLFGFAAVVVLTDTPEHAVSLINKKLNSIEWSDPPPARVEYLVEIEANEPALFTI